MCYIYFHRMHRRRVYIWFMYAREMRYMYQRTPTIVEYILCVRIYTCDDSKPRPCQIFTRLTGFFFPFSGPADTNRFLERRQRRPLYIAVINSYLQIAAASMTFIRNAKILYIRVHYRLMAILYFTCNCSVARFTYCN